MPLCYDEFLLNFIPSITREDVDRLIEINGKNNCEERISDDGQTYFIVRRSRHPHKSIFIINQEIEE